MDSIALIITGAVALAVEGWFALQLLRRNARLRAQFEAIGAPAAADLAPVPSVGSPAPGFRLRDLDGKKVTLDALREDGRGVMLLFVAPDCGPCSTLTPDIVRWQTEYAPAIGFALVSSGSVEANQAKVAARGAKRVLLQKNFEVGKAYGVSGTPSAIIVHPDGTIASPLAGGADTIRALLDQYVEALAYEAGVELEDEGEVARAARAAASPLQIRAPAPDLEFRDLTGKIVRLVDFRGRGTVLLFWSLSCRFCREMLPDLREWEAARPRGAPDLLVILATPPGAGQAVSFLSPVMMDRESAAAQALHANGTPTAVLIDADGNVASQPAVGAVPVLELLGWTPMEEERASA